MTNLTFAIGLIGSLLLVTGAAWPSTSKKTHPARSIKNWLFAIGAVFMLTYAILNNTLNQGSSFFIILQSFASIAGILMLLNIRETVSGILVSSIGIILILLSFTLFEENSAMLFILGLTGIALGYIFKPGLKREISLLSGGILIAIFSYLGASWVFFWLNLFFSFFAAYYTTKLILKKH